MSTVKQREEVEEMQQLQRMRLLQEEQARLRQIQNEQEHLAAAEKEFLRQRNEKLAEELGVGGAVSAEQTAEEQRLAREEEEFLEMEKMVASEFEKEFLKREEQRLVRNLKIEEEAAKAREAPCQPAAAEAAAATPPPPPPPPPPPEPEGAEGGEPPEGAEGGAPAAPASPPAPAAPASGARPKTRAQTCSRLRTPLPSLRAVQEVLESFQTETSPCPMRRAGFMPRYRPAPTHTQMGPLRRSYQPMSSTSQTCPMSGGQAPPSKFHPPSLSQTCPMSGGQAPPSRLRPPSMNMGQSMLNESMIRPRGRGAMGQPDFMQPQFGMPPSGSRAASRRPAGSKVCKMPAKRRT
ncbi:actin cytoskeleton-regulatory complex protein pan1-like [Chiloscyllium plagiosum]|uniref:actin cytoskeleton-regulatory complex protein pan1-like n=1 Tax=Chiloscyllium plagiosum TaxID=36176 RepID=UPI001CB82188|nr:actin cytoskeleton-regulatory complex protein pan1-like [Chiloscyllium plagiosum]